ncbi:acetyltransferase, GNAT family [Filifactor alocis ATCC 35896]|uniref:Acetyltransferase, GNAT family n=1 Tax=Filifactor alocis (strain ATCC 35896 / CCUG 47790 / D40 B5) TaxID=546269 RepID=D6GR53_FILAD|nr:GNAT family N-acetyltransferase [Filifactor alocis]EFE28144.2 acetyltransferase, GNAT family [Filifactor alocis ATCC 35896]
MSIKLVRIGVNDAEKLWTMQVQAFQKLLDKYQDLETNPANETKEKIKTKLLQKQTFFYYIYEGNDIVGAIRVIDKKDGSRKRVAPLFIMEKFRNKGLAQKAFCEIERIHGKDNWELDTIFQEKGNCYLYEKLGYIRIGEIDRINDRMDIVHYIKN